MLQHGQIPIHGQAPRKKIRVHYLKQPACQFARLPNLWWSQCHCLKMFPRSPCESQPFYRDSGPEWLAGKCLALHLRVRAAASDISYFLLLFGRNSILDFQSQTLSSVQRRLCSTALLGLVALPLATASVEGSHHVFLMCLGFIAILLSFLAHCEEDFVA